MGAQSKIYSVSDKDFIDLVTNSKSQKDVARSLGIKGHSFGKQLHRRCEELGIQIKYRRTQIPIDEILVEHSVFHRGHLLERILKDNIKEYVCEKCGNTGWWQGTKLTL